MTTADHVLGRPYPKAPGGSHSSGRGPNGLIWSLERAFERNKAAGHAVDDGRFRIFVVLFLFGLMFIGLALGATRAAVRGLGAQPQTRAAPLVSASRSELADRNGNVLALDLMHYGVYLDARDVWDQDETRRALAAALPRLSETRLDRALNSGKRTLLIGGLTPEDRTAIHALGLAGVSFETEERRVYPLGATAAHLIGFSDRGGQGLAGAERAFNEPLRADGGAGEPLQLSIDLRVQSVLEEELTAAAADLKVKGAVGVITDVHTGEILGMASYPDYDPNDPGAATPEQLLNRAAGSVYEMGSTFKGFTVAAGLESGRFTRASTFDATQPFRMGGRVVRDFHASNKVLTLDEVFTKSSNIGTSRIALGVGSELFAKYMNDWGLMAPAPVELVESARPIKPSKWSETTLASASFGHAISVTPLQLTAAMNAIVNGGKYVPLTIKKRGPREQVEGRQVLSPATSQAMLEIMRLNVTDGSGRKADAPGLRVGGKTGTGEKVVDGRYSDFLNVSSFAAVFPTDGPAETKRYFVLILMDEPKGSLASAGQRTGGWTSAPAAGRIINRVAPFLGVARKVDPIPDPALLAAAGTAPR
jgi:cell division protein FtsI (penicillin-binding protein 3)